MIKWIASWRCAVVLIFFAMCCAAGGTFIESRFTREDAESWIFHSLPFKLLLAGFFLNILSSTLIRFPFKARHLPFLTTHLGLLMVIAGLFAKTTWGLQGEMRLIEGSGSRFMKLPHVKALWLETRMPAEASSIPLDSIETLRILEYHPHALQSYFGWVSDKDTIKIWGMPPIPFQEAPFWIDMGLKSQVAVFGRHGASWKDSYEKIKKTFYNHYFILVHLSPAKEVTLVAEAPLENPKIFSFPSKKLEKWTAYDRGFKGYTLTAEWEWDSRKFSLETPLRRRFVTEENNTGENNKPLIIIKHLGKKIPLSYDAVGEELKWPLGDGNTLLKFQPHRVPIPYRIRLHSSKAICYPGSDKPCSYEALISLSSANTSLPQQILLQMNKVHETTEGYRIYLAGMGKIDRLGVSAAHLVINYDPFKYWLTYPGAVLVVLGAVSLFLFKPPKN
jgi:hypothetical protein